MRTVTYPTWWGAFGQHPSRESVVTELRQLDKLHTVWLLGRINMLLSLARFKDEARETIALQTYLVNGYFDEGTFEALKAKYGPERLDQRQPFHSQQVLSLMKMALVECSNNGGKRPDVEEAARFALGRCLLASSDLLFSERAAHAIRRERPSKLKKALALQLQLGPGFEINNLRK